MNNSSPRARLIQRRVQNDLPAAPTQGDPAAAAAQTLNRFSRSSYKALEAMFPPRIASDPTQAAQYLGQQQVLTVIRQQFLD